MVISNHPAPVSTYTKGRTGSVKFGVVHFVSAKNLPEYKNDPYSMEGVFKIFDEYGPVRKFSCHFVIDRGGQVYKMVEIKDTAWHAGRSVIAMPTYHEDINAMSVGIEVVGMEGKPFELAQYKTLGKLAAIIEDAIEALRIGSIQHWVGHDFISGVIAVRLGKKKPEKMKVDPGKLFDWPLFHKERHEVKLGKEITRRLNGTTDKIKAELNQVKRYDIRKMSFWERLTFRVGKNA